jgi:CBS domain-containing protein
MESLQEADMRVQDLMTRGVKTISPTAGAEDAWNLMQLHGIHHLVVTAGADVVGVLSDRDAGGVRGAAVRANRAVSDLMTAPAVTIEPTATVRRAASVMRGRSIGCLVVLQAGRVKGIVTVSDLLDLVGQGIERTVTTTERRIMKHRTPHRKMGRVAGVW